MYSSSVDAGIYNAADIPLNIKIVRLLVDVSPQELTWLEMGV
jgi:hypothetical protein